jgi:predicted CoA-binding protein
MNDLKAILEAAETIAVVGCSGNPSRTSYAISRYLQEVGYRIIPVNPNYEEVHGERCYPDLASVPQDASIDLVDIFRNPRHTAEMVEHVVARARATGERPVVWTQLGVSTPEAERLAKEAALPYVKNRCILVEHSRLLH